MKIGILTFHSSYNFGANLQTLAIQELLKRKGCLPVVIDYRDPWRTEMYRSAVLPAQAQAHERFIDKYLDTSPRFNGEEEVREYCDGELDVILVGSDQVFRLLPRWAPKQILRRLRTGRVSSSWTEVSDRLPVYYLPWSRNGGRTPVRAAIAASACSTPFMYLGPSLHRQARQYLLDFDYVTVRDDWTGLMVRWLSGGRIKPQLCPDPVFGLNRCVTVPKDEVPDIDVTRTILVGSTLDRTWLVEFVRIAHERGWKVSNLPDPDATFASDGTDFTISLPLSPLGWYVLLSRARGYIGGRFHGLVSCAANRTPAVSLDVSNKPRIVKMMSRPYDLCRRAGARSRYVPINRLAHPSPMTVMNRLLDASSQAAMNAYAEHAKARVEQVIDEILEQAREVVQA
jgi:hypothetical protein